MGKRNLNPTEPPHSNEKKQFIPSIPYAMTRNINLFENLGLWSL